MRREIAILTVIIWVVALLAAGKAFAAEPNIKECGEGYVSTDLNGRNKWHNHNHCVEKEEHEKANLAHKHKVEHEAGVGADVVLWQSEKYEALIEEVAAEYRYDIRGEEHKVYGVVRLNLWQKFIKKIFGKGEEDVGLYTLGGE